MALFGKKKPKEEKKEIKSFEIPSPPSEMQKIKETVNEGELPELPSFQTFSMPSFKDLSPSISSSEPEEKEEKWSIDREKEERPRTQEVGEDFRVPVTASVGSYGRPEVGYSGASAISIPTTRFDKPIFVKIDKFKDALESFELVKKKMHEIDNLLRRIKETRLKENEELASWESEIEDIKLKIDSIDKKLFSKLD